MATEAELKQKVSSQSNVKMDQIVYDGTTKTETLPKAHGKSLQIAVMGRYKLDFTTAPTPKRGGYLANLLSRVEINDARGMLKDLQISDIKAQSERLTGDCAPIVCKVGAPGVILDSASLVDQAEIQTMTSGQEVVFYESVNLSFECEIALANFLDTLLQYNGRDNNTIRLVCEKVQNLYTGGTGVVISNVDIVFDLDYIIMANSGLGRRWKQWQTERPFIAPITKAKIDLDSVDMLAGLNIEITKGPLRTPISPIEARLIKFDLVVKRNGSETYLKSQQDLLSLASLDSNKKSQYKMKPHRATMSLISGNLIESAEQNTYTEMSLYVTMPLGLTYDPNNAYNVRVVVDEIE